MPSFVAQDWFEEKGMPLHKEWVTPYRMAHYSEWLWYSLRYQGPLTGEHLIGILYARHKLHGNRKCNQMSQCLVYIPPSSTIESPVFTVLPKFNMPTIRNYQLMQKWAQDDEVNDFGY